MVGILRARWRTMSSFARKWAALGAVGLTFWLVGCSLSTADGDTLGPQGAGGNASCASFAADEAQPMTLHLVNQSGVDVHVFDDCAEQTNPALDGVVIDGRSLSTFASCDDLLEGRCQLDCFGSGPGPVVPAGGTLDVSWSGLLLTGDGVDLPEACVPEGCSAQLCERLKVLAPGAHQVAVEYSDETGMHTATQSFTAPVASITIVLP
jgi:hypothetical protein